MLDHLPSLSRRDLLKIAAAGAASAIPLLRAEAHAAPAPAKFRGEFYRFRIGEMNAVVLSDGSWTFPEPKGIWAPDARPDAFRGALAAYRLKDDALVLHVNVLALEHAPGKWAVVDAGARDFFGPTLGKLPVSLAAAGIAPDSVTDVLLSHAHGDHFGGIFKKEGEPFFPQAAIHAADIEADFWTGKPDISSTLWPQEVKTGFVTSAQAFFRAAAPRLRRFRAGEKLLGGRVTAIPTPGHTPGHTAFLIESNGESLLHLVDVPPHHVLAFSHPDWEVGFDTDRKVARATRQKAFAEADRSGVRLLGYHLPFPGLGRVRTYQGAYEWLPETPLFPGE